MFLMLNNKGQSLVAFLILFPIVILIMFIVIDILNARIVKNSLDNISKIAITYGVNNIDSSDIVSKIEKLLYKNNSKLDSVDVRIDDGKVYIDITERQEMIIDIGFDYMMIKSSLYGYNYEGKIVIERNK